MAERLIGVPGVEAVALGGSRARGTATPGSDWDVGVYYRRPLDVHALGRLARALAGPDAAVSSVGEWGPWVDGGGWLRLGEDPVDWIYRDLDRVRRSVADAAAGRYAFHTQVGHPFGVPDFGYAAEVAGCVLLADPTGELAGLQRATAQYPPALADALVAGLWEADFVLAGARKAASRSDTVFVAGCLFRAVGLCAHAVLGRAGRWVAHEKGLVDAAASAPGAPAGFAEQAAAVLGRVGESPEQLTATLDRAQDLITRTRRAGG